MRVKRGASFSSIFCFLLACFSHAQEALLVNDGVEAAKIRTDLIREAKKSIHLSMYLIRPDRAGYMLLKELADAAQRGVAVTALIDDVYLKALPAEVKEYVVACGVKLYTYNPLQPTMPLDYTRRSHDKVWAIDEEWTNVGDRNIGNEYFGLTQNPAISREVVVKHHQTARDGMHYIESSLKLAEVKPVEAKGDEKLFEAGKSLLESQYKKASTQSVESAMEKYKNWKNQLIPVESVSFNNTGLGSREDPLDLDAAFLKDIQEAQKSIVIENPYIILVPEYAQALKEALGRGVKVEIYTNSRFSSNNAFVAAAWEDSRKLLAEAGAEIYEHPGGPIESFRSRARKRKRQNGGKGILQDLKDRIYSSRNFLHAKTTTIDGRISYVMSYNLDPRSKNLNREVSMRIVSREFAYGLSKAIHDDSERLHYLKVAAHGHLNKVAPTCFFGLRWAVRIPWVRRQL